MQRKFAMAGPEILLCLLVVQAGRAWAQVDPGPRSGAAGAGSAFPGLSAHEKDFFNAARDKFQEINSVSGGIAGEDSSGLGPTFNGNSCAACHAQPDLGGTSPHPTLGQVRKPNPQIAFATLDRAVGGNQAVPPFIFVDGPVREARFIRHLDGTKDGGVHGLYTIAGRVDAPGCVLPQPDFPFAIATRNVVFRIPTPVFGLGLMENVPDLALRSNLGHNHVLKAALGISGRFNTSGNDGTITRFGWKAQNKSLLIFAAEAYNVEQGVSNEGFPNERSAVANCVFNATPEDSTNIINPNPPTGRTTGTANEMSSDTLNFAFFMRLTAPPTPTTHTPSELNGQRLFGTSVHPGIGCVLCHSETLTTGRSPFTGMSNHTFRPFTDIALHRMGPGLADFVDQGIAGPDEFRTAPLWGVGQRIFFLHDGRAGSANGGLLTAILAHESSDPSCSIGQHLRTDGVACRSEANAVIRRFRALRPSEQQDLLNFLRSL
jgi:CxxC motif-containing protein (DUF1111 family)